MLKNWMLKNRETFNHAVLLSSCCVIVWPAGGSRDWTVISLIMKKWRNDVFNLINNYIYSKWFTSVDQCLSIWPAGGAAGLQIAQSNCGFTGWQVNHKESNTKKWTHEDNKRAVLMLPCNWKSFFLKNYDICHTQPQQKYIHSRKVLHNLKESDTLKIL